jgi:hypothetical protein
MAAEAQRFATWLKTQRVLQDTLDTGDGFRAAQPVPPPRRYCKPCVSPDWDIEPASGSCRNCGGELREAAVRRWHAIACAERLRLTAKGLMPAADRLVRARGRSTEPTP